jgi:hypothetical protein
MRLQAGVFERGQQAGEMCEGDPQVLARLFSGIISAFQALDPQVMSDAPAGEERFPLTDLHALVDRTFVTGRSAPR